MEWVSRGIIGKETGEQDNGFVRACLADTSETRQQDDEPVVWTEIVEDPRSKPAEVARALNKLIPEALPSPPKASRARYCQCSKL